MSGGGGLGFSIGITRAPEKDCAQQPQNNNNDDGGGGVAGRQKRLLTGR